MYVYLGMKVRTFFIFLFFGMGGGGGGGVQCPLLYFGLISKKGSCVGDLHCVAPSSREAFFQLNFCLIIGPLVEVLFTYLFICYFF